LERLKGRIPGFFIYGVIRKRKQRGFPTNSDRLCSRFLGHGSFSMSQARDVLCAGIIVADHVCTPISHLPGPGELVMADHLLLTLGGCAANTAVDLAKMGASAAVVGRVGADLFGRIVGDMLRAANVDTAAMKAVPETDTSQTLIINVAGQDRRYIHTFGANAGMVAADIPLNQLESCKVLYLGGFLLMAAVTGTDLARVFAHARSKRVATVLDVVTPPGVDYLKQLEPILPFTDVFLPNNDEARLITGERDPLRQAETFRRMGAKTVVITCGGDGAILVTDSVRLKSGVYPMPFVDGSGGGDAFDAGYIYGLLHNFGLEDCLRYASALGASCVRAIGTTPGVFTRDECEDFLRKNALKIDRI
jgi:sugar/nucleoside kinase (ribokinase family)